MKSNIPISLIIVFLIFFNQIPNQKIYSSEFNGIYVLKNGSIIASHYSIHPKCFSSDINLVFDKNDSNKDFFLILNRLNWFGIIHISHFQSLSEAKNLFLFYLKIIL